MTTKNDELYNPMTVREFSQRYCHGTLRVYSGFNGKLLCKNFNPNKHFKTGEREIIAVWAEIVAGKMQGFRQKIEPVTCVYVHGDMEAEERLRRAQKND